MSQMPVSGSGPSLFPPTHQCFLLILQNPPPLSSYPVPIFCSSLSCFLPLPGLCHRSLHKVSVYSFLFPNSLATSHNTWVKDLCEERKREWPSAFSCAKCRNQQEQISSTLVSSENPNSEEFSRWFRCKTSEDGERVWSSLCFFQDFFDTVQVPVI